MDKNVVLLVGGVGGAKLAAGLAACLPASQLTIIGNSGDDFIHLGLPISPDLDTVMYTLAGVSNVETGWGRAGESWRTMGALQELDAPSWFNLGDLDLATHLTRAHLLANGATLTAATAYLCRQFGVERPLLPMSDQPAPTRIQTDDGVFSFQEWFVQQRWQPAARKIILPPDITATGDVIKALQNADVVVFAPSNPFVSIDPILNVYPIRPLIEDMPALVVAVSPIIGGKAVKGPAAKMMGEMGMAVSAAAVAAYYGDLVDLFVYDQVDAGSALPDNQHQLAAQTWMKDDHDRVHLAQTILNKVETLLS